MTLFRTVRCILNFRDDSLVKDFLKYAFTNKNTNDEDKSYDMFDFESGLVFVKMLSKILQSKL